MTTDVPSRAVFHHGWRGLTLVELLAVIAILGILAAITLPAVQRAREAARGVSCRNHLRQMATGVLAFHETFGHLPPGGLFFIGANPPAPPISYDTYRANVRDDFSFHYQILPYLDELTVFDAGSEATPAAIRNARAKHLRCPSDPGSVAMNSVPSATNYCASAGPNQVSAYVGCANPFSVYGNRPDLGYGNSPPVSSLFVYLKDVRGMFAGNTPRCGGPNALDADVLSWLPTRCRGAGPMGPREGVLKIRDAHITDGMAYVLMLGEIIPDESRDIRFGNAFNAFATTEMNRTKFTLSTLIPINTFTPKPSSDCATDGDYIYGNWATSIGFKSRHASGANFAFGDGTVRFVSDAINHDTFQQLGCRNDGFQIYPP